MLNSREKNMIGKTKRHLYAGCATILLLSACGEGGAKKTLTQVAAKVDGTEISIHQINALLPQAQELPTVSGMAPEQMRRVVLDKLIDQQVIYARALDKKIDRDPKVAMLIDTAKREIIARAYMESLLATPPSIIPADVHQYYVENPALFSQRRIYTLQEITLKANPPALESLKRMIDDGKDLQDIGKYLTAKGLEFNNTNGVRAAEQIPLDVLPRLSVIEDGNTALIESGNRYYIFHVVSSQVTPVDEANARPQIAIFLSNQQSQRLVAQEVKRLKANARIEYLGDFAKPASTEAADTVATLKMERSTQ